jgi:light-regulated signal transduction histidine kinase (bacteriophytochrome)
MREQTDSLRNELMDNDITAETVRNLEALVASLTELLDVQETVVGEQSGRLKQNEEALKESNDRFLAFIKEAAMRLKNPLEVVEGNLAVVVNDIEHGESETRNVSLLLRIQIKNLEQIRKNIIELNKAIVDHSGELSDASKKFLTE